MMCSHINEAELVRQASVARKLGSPFVARVLEAGQRQLFHAPATRHMIANWPSDPARAAMAMRFNGALHALARRGVVPALGILYARKEGDFDGPIAAALAQEDDFIATWMQRTPQTNEVGRSAAIVAALLVAHADHGLPFELLELGSSAGLNLNLARYAYDLGGAAIGPSNSTVRLSPDWTGPAIRPATIEMVSARGVDIDPLDPADVATRERLLAYVWADQPERAERLDRALTIARDHPPQIDRDNAADWIERQLLSLQDEGVCRVVFHSMVLQYLHADDRARVASAIHAAAEQASVKRPLVWIQFEWNADRTDVMLQMTSWPDGRKRDLARCHAYAAWIDWIGA
ncbi:DUF2332 domain-containing protein [Sphingomonas sp. GB1N7]|uniref:DUF2332 domain-containing protein n=1 Tax=Parasphingomonas caseinilytica TaxID=3096158 RepID=UPI002FC71A0D